MSFKTTKNPLKSFTIEYGDYALMEEISEGKLPKKIAYDVKKGRNKNADTVALFVECWKKLQANKKKLENQIKKAPLKYAVN